MQKDFIKIANSTETFEEIEVFAEIFTKIVGKFQEGLKLIFGEIISKF